MADSALVDPEIALVVESLLERAALLGAFDPRQIIDPDHPQVIKTAALRALSKQCSEVATDTGRFAWRLKPDVRREVLQNMQSQDKLVSTATSYVHNPQLAQDNFAKSLINAVLGRPLPSAADNALLDDAYAAALFIDQLDQGRSAQGIGTIIERQVKQSALEFVRPTVLVGRAKELRALTQFVLAAPGPEVEGPSQRAPLMLIQGIGGSGKSALLAEFAHRLSGSDWDGVPVIWFDFDEAALATFNELTLTTEFVRQLALYGPPHDDLLTFRRIVADIQSGEHDDEGATLQRHVDQSRGWSLWRELVRPHLSAYGTIVLILDTFEEVLVRDGSVVRGIERWIDALAAEGGMYNLRSLICGRTVPAAWRSHGRRVRTLRLRIGDLSHTDALVLLQRLLADDVVGPSVNTLRLLLRKFGGNPLLIKLLARVIGEGDRSAAADLLSEQPFDQSHKTLAKGFLYRRVLQRMRVDDDDVKRIAHPGLVLRRVTPDLIRKVLAKPCGLVEVDENRALTLFEKLARQVWLVERTARGSVLVHRRDLRRIMLQIMNDDDADTAEEIHRAARGYYARGDDPVLSKHEQNLEFAYHSLFLNEVVVSSPEEAAELVKSIGTDIDCISETMRAKIKAMAGFRVSGSERRRLSHAEILELEAKIARTRLAKGERPAFSQAFSDAFSAEAIGTNLPPSRLVAFVEERFVQGDFDGVMLQARNCFEYFLSGELQSVYDSSTGALINSPVWRVVLAALATRRSADLRSIIQDLVSPFKSAIHWDSPFIRHQRGMSVGQAMRLIFKVLELRDPSLDIKATGRPYFAITNTDELRFLQADFARLNTIGNDALHIRLGLLQNTSRSFWNFIISAVEKDAMSAQSHRNGFSARQLWEWARGNPGGNAVNKGYVVDVDMSQQMITVPSTIGIGAWEFLGLGMVPELHQLYRRALDEANDEAILDFAAHARETAISDYIYFELKKVYNPWLDQLTRESLREGLRRDRPRWLATLVEASDRSALLKEMAVYFASREKQGARWAEIGMLISAYEARLLAVDAISSNQPRS